MESVRESAVDYKPAEVVLFYIIAYFVTQYLYKMQDSCKCANDFKMLSSLMNVNSINILTVTLGYLYVMYGRRGAVTTMLDYVYAAGSYAFLILFFLFARHVLSQDCQCAKTWEFYTMLLYVIFVVSFILLGVALALYFWAYFGTMKKQPATVVVVTATGGDKTVEGFKTT